jgi:hypothetical protein
MNDVVQTLRDFGGILERLNLTYAVIGGIAVRAYGIPRPTFDIDFTLAIPRERLPEFFNSVEEHGYTVPDSYRSGWVDLVADMPLVKVRCYIQGQGVDVDVFLAENDYQREILARRSLVETPDGDVWLASPEDIVLLKLLASRGRDLSDVNDILFTQGTLDDEYLRRWARWLDISGRLEEAFRLRDEMV